MTGEKYGYTVVEEPDDVEAWDEDEENEEEMWE